MLSFQPAISAQVSPGVDSWKRIRGRLRLKLPAPVDREPYRPLPEDIRVRWEAFARLDESSREWVVRNLGAWEAMLSPPQQAGLRFEGFTRIVQAYAAEVGDEWALLLESPMAGLVMREFLPTVCTRMLTDAARRHIGDIIGVMPIVALFKHIRGVRDRLLAEMWGDGDLAPGRFPGPSA